MWWFATTSDLKAPTYKDQSPVGRAFMVRHLVFSRSVIFKRERAAKTLGDGDEGVQHAHR
jgi:hypothetical protein